MSQGYQIYPQKCYKTSEHLFRLSPRQIFLVLSGAFSWDFL